MYAPNKGQTELKIDNVEVKVVRFVIYSLVESLSPLSNECEINVVCQAI